MEKAAARAQHLQWLQDQLASNDEQIVVTEQQIETLQGQLERLKKNSEYFRQMILLTQTQSEEMDSPQEVSAKSVAFDESSFAENDYSAGEQQANETEAAFSESINYEGRRTPGDMKREQFRHLTFGEAIETVLNSCQRPMSIPAILEAIFEAETEEERERTRASLSVELRRGAKNKRWKKVFRNLYATNSYDPPSVFSAKTPGQTRFSEIDISKAFNS